MTSYILSIGYCPERGAVGAWDELKRIVRDVCDVPNEIIAEARALGAPEQCDRGCCKLDTFADNYAGPYSSSEGHPVTVHEDGDPYIVQHASTGDHIKYCVRRAFVRLVIRECHRNKIEVNLRVS